MKEQYHSLQGLLVPSRISNFVLPPIQSTNRMLELFSLIGAFEVRRGKVQLRSSEAGH